jgi:hypothetical protein
MGGSNGAKPAGKKSFTSGTPGYQGGGNFWDFNPRSIAGLNQFQTGAGNVAAGLGGVGKGNLSMANQYLKDLAGGGSGYLGQGVSAANRYSGGNLPSQFGEAQGLLSKLQGLGGSKVTGENLATDPALKAAQARFAQTQLPLIQNQAAMAGLGRSSALTNAIAHGNAASSVPFIQDALAREERGIDRNIGTTNQAIQNLLGIGGTTLDQNARGASASLQGAGQEASNLANAASGQSGIAAQQYGNAANQSQLLNALGQGYQGTEQAQLDAPHQEQQRLWAEALNSMYGPLSFLGNMGGATTSSSKK